MSRTVGQAENSTIDRITIGVPVYNESKHVARALSSALGQGRRIMVSDNGSSDGTAQICQRFADQHPEVELIRHDQNMGSSFNFGFVLDQCETEYFMWLGAHDRIPAGYTQSLAAILDAEADAILAYPDARHVDSDGQPGRVEDYQVLRGHLAACGRDERMQAIVRHLNDCSLIHGLWRAAALRAAWTSERYLGVDHVILLNAAAAGRMIHTASTHFVRGNPRKGDSHSLQLERITGGNKAGRPTYTRMQRSQLRIVRSTLGISAWLRAGLSILTRLGVFNSRGYLRLLGLSRK